MLDTELLYRRYSRHVSRWAARYHYRERDDIVQNVFLVAYLKRDALAAIDDETGKLRAWLFRTTYNVAREHRRRDRDSRWLDAEEREASPSEQSSVPSSQEQYEQYERRRTLHRAINSIPRGHRATLLLFDIEGLDGGEIAEQLGLPLGTVWSRLHRARRLVRRRLEGVLNE